MKKYLLYSMVVWIAFFTACEEQYIEPFGDRHEVYFKRFFKDEVAPGTAKADSTNVTFFFAKPTDTYVMAELVVVLAGRPLAKDLHFGLKVVKEMTTANPDEYELADSYTFHAGPIAEDLDMFQDTIRIRMNKSDRLGSMENGVRLVVELVPGEGLAVGQFERSRAVIHFTKDAVKPEWWDREVEYYSLGRYSTLKYKTFLENIEGAYDLNAEMIRDRPDKVRKLVVAFKDWLADHQIWDEENNEWMSVNV
ncbi:DUF4843 domain-containing protein [uncultured Sanguibacteroides sp.]|uniref:DUF4843 domain-containing protein n=1 Tax=uncultured Sanguibacteroides sp. TaxID=1635151 RepID=UPI0025F34079|nr:DUF4843 domain-containing protein [uncultured Sanguibacteroides sp.]